MLLDTKAIGAMWLMINGLHGHGAKAGLMRKRMIATGGYS